MSEKNEVVIEVVAQDEVALPLYASDGASGADVCAHLKEPMVLAPAATALVPTGMKAAIPLGYEIQVRPRSGLALKHQITVLNAPGTIDADYRGEIKVLVINHGKEPFVIEPGMRIAQLVVCPVLQARFLRCDELGMTVRGANGFGHTGI